MVLKPWMPCSPSSGGEDADGDRRRHTERDCEQLGPFAQLGRSIERHVFLDGVLRDPFVREPGFDPLVQPLFEVGIDVVIANPLATLLAEAGIFGVLGTAINADECCHDGDAAAPQPHDQFRRLHRDAFIRFILTQPRAVEVYVADCRILQAACRCA